MVPKRYMPAHLTSMGTDHDLTSRFELEQGSGILDAPGEVWLTLARLEATRLQVQIRDLSGRAAIAWIRWHALANTWGNDWGADEWRWKTSLLVSQIADLTRALDEENAKIADLTRELIDSARSDATAERTT